MPNVYAKAKPGKTTSRSKMPTLLSAPRVYIKINSTIVAYAIGINVSIDVDVRPVPALGLFAPAAYEPVMYGVVTGNMQIVKLVNKNTLDNFGKSIVTGGTKLDGDKTVSNKTTNGGLYGSSQSNGNFQNDGGDQFAANQFKSANAITDDNSLLNLLDSNGNPISFNLDPNNILLSSTFDLDIYINYGIALGTAAVPFGLLALQQTYGRRRKGRKSRRTRRR